MGIPASVFPAPPPAKEQTLAARKARIGRNLSISYRAPLKIVRGLGVYLYDDTGRPYLDCVNNVAHVGHCHPHVVAAGQRQMAVLNTNTRYLHDSIITYAQRLCATLPEPLSVCFFVNSGSEANDLALRLARAATSQFDMVTLDVAYHGHTQALIEVSPYKHDGPGGMGRPPYVQKVMMPDPYRGPHKGYGAENGRRYAHYVQEAVTAIQEQGHGVAGFIAESLMGCGGQLVFPDDFLGDRIRPCACGRRHLHRRRGADRLWPGRQPLLGLPNPGLRPRYRHHGQARGQWPSAGRRGHYTGNSG